MQIQSMARFHPHLPLEGADEQVPAPAPSNFRILIVNEDMRSADSLKCTLFDLGYVSIFTAYSARRALVAAVDFYPSVALLDLELPEMTGYQLAQRMRSHLSRNVRKLPLLAIAESTSHGTAELTRAAVFMGWLPKPVDAMALNAQLAKLQPGAC